MTRHTAEFECIKTYTSYSNKSTHYNVTLKSINGMIFTAGCNWYNYGKFTEGKKYRVEYSGDLESIIIMPRIWNVEELE